MKFGLLCKRYYTNKDLIQDNFGRLYHLPIQLGKQGHKGLVVAADYRNKQREILNELNVKFCTLPLRPTKLISFIQQSYHEFSVSKPDVLIASGDSHLGYLGLKISQRLSVPFVFDIYDDYRVFGSNRLPGMKTLFKHAIAKADSIICASHVLGRKLAALNSRITIIENGVDPKLFRPIPKDHARQMLDLVLDDTIVGFFGSIDRNHGVEDLLAAAEILRKDIPNMRVLLAGHNALGLNLAQAGIDYRGLLPQEQIPWLINACDVVVIPNRSDPQWDVSNPCKLVEYIACNIPIAATSVGDNSELLTAIPEALCNPDNPADLAKKIKQQLTLQQKIPLSHRFTWSALGADLERLLSDLINQSDNANIRQIHL